MATAPQSQAPLEASSQTMWHPDGDFIIKVVKDGEIHLHRVHGFLLRLHSDILCDMFAVGGLAEQDKQHGCPVVQFHDDPEDIYRLLQVLYYPGSVPHEKLRQRTFDELEPVLRLADKYEMRDIVRRLLPLLEQDWPSSLIRWDTNEAEIKLLSELIENEVDQPDFQSLDDILPEPCRVIRLARQCSINSVLPAAFYHLSRLSEDKDDDPTDTWGTGRRAAKKYLAAEDWSSLHHGTRKIRLWCHTLIHEFTSAMGEYPISQHDAHSKCPASLLRFIPSMTKKLESELFGTNRLMAALDPLPKLKYPHQLLTDVDGYHTLCRTCGRKAHDFLHDKRVQFWLQLPSFFQLPLAQPR